MYVIYLSQGFEFYAQYCGTQAGYYRNVSKKDRRLAEIAAHQAGVKQLPRHANKLSMTLNVIDCNGGIINDLKW